MSIWKFTFAMMAMSMYMGTPLVLVLPEGVMVIAQKHD